MGSGKLPSSPWAAQVHGSTCSNPWAYGPHGMTIARDIPLSHYNHPMSVWLSHFLSSHVRMGYPTSSDMSQTVRGPVSIKKYCPTALLVVLPCCPTTALLPCCHAALLPCCPAALLPCCPTTALLPYCPTALLPSAILLPSC
jgi:hypothetical protein